ncbi:hypothetical protein RJT34_20664 [Clitoria ternatea]|uniref:Uncharacterized protein n=1 Tax=Clitoria ternatea TaxID=43366 RepID=A0AAN9IT63_CLITE
MTASPLFIVSQSCIGGEASSIATFSLCLDLCLYRTSVVNPYSRGLLYFSIVNFRKELERHNHEKGEVLRKIMRCLRFVFSQRRLLAQCIRVMVVMYFLNDLKS